MKPKYLIKFLVFITIAISVHADVAIKSEKQTEIEKMIQLIGIKQMIDQMSAQMLTQLKTSNPNMPESYWTKVQIAMSAQSLLDKMIPIYDKYFTLEELKETNKFYSSPVGQGLVTKLPIIMQESSSVGKEWGAESIERLKQLEREESNKQK
jgi:hypothetical protein